MPIYYPGERLISADLIAVLDVEMRERDSWVVDLEGKGVDFALEIHVRRDRRKDITRNVEQYARLGIPEYFVFDRARGDLFGFRLPTPKAAVYERIAPHQGRIESRVLGLDLALLGNKLRFLVGDAAVPNADELVTRLGATLDEVLTTKNEAEERVRQLESEIEEEQKRREEEQKRREEAERRLVELQVELERLKRG